MRKGEYARLSGKQRRFIKGQNYTPLSRRENLTLEGRQALRTLLRIAGKWAIIVSETVMLILARKSHLYRSGSCRFVVRSRIVKSRPELNGSGRG